MSQSASDLRSLLLASIHEVQAKILAAGISPGHATEVAGDGRWLVILSAEPVDGARENTELRNFVIEADTGQADPRTPAALRRVLAVCTADVLSVKEIAGKLHRKANSHLRRQLRELDRVYEAIEKHGDGYRLRRSEMS